jgi:hypothetical protein
MKSTRFTLLTALLTGTLAFSSSESMAHGPDSQHHKAVRKSHPHNGETPRPSSVRPILSAMHTQIRFLEADVSEGDLSRVHGYSIRIENLADELSHASTPEDPMGKNKARSYLRNLKSLIGKIHHHGDAGRIGAAQANVRKLRAQFALLSRQYGYSFKMKN